MALLGTLWGSSFLWIKIGLSGYTPLQIVLARMILGFLVLAAIVGVSRQRLPRRPRTWMHLAVAAIFGNVIPYTSFGIAEQQIDSAAAGVLNGTTPLWTVILAVLARHEAFSAQRLLGVVAGFAGVLVLFGVWDLNGGIATTGGLICLLAATSYGISYIYMSRFLATTEISTLALSASQLGIGAAMTAALVAALDRSPPETELPATLAVAVLGVFCTGLAYLLNYRIIRDDGATAASVVTYLLPVVAITLGALVLDEPITAQTVAGTIIILGGVVLTRTHRPTGPD